MQIKPPVRSPDSYGAGYFGASRGSRKHAGVDFACAPGSKILSPISGLVTKLGYPYSDDLSFRYVEVTAIDNLRYRFFYVDPCVKVGGNVLANESVLGTSQRLGLRYPADAMHAFAITEHIHFEIKALSEDYIDPLEMLEDLHTLGGA
ncbi:MAG: hypothetical protein DRQ48_01860 [Gammaproteobacteria bacterium]|nr:MAG: hypothetical protein DRQ48_01860 [Gammaproteobacteria bacterium]